MEKKYEDRINWYPDVFVIVFAKLENQEISMRNWKQTIPPMSHAN